VYILIYVSVKIIDVALFVTFRCLESVISACGKDANAYIDSELLDVISCTLTSSSRFVRESAFTLLTAIVNTNLTDGEFLIIVPFSSFVTSTSGCQLII